MSDFIVLITIKDEIIQIKKSNIVMFISSKEGRHILRIKLPNNTLESYEIKADPYDIVKNCL